MPSLELPGATINYEIGGSGEPLLMIRGYGSHLGWWDPGLISVLEKDFEVIRYDHRGTGRSTHSKGEYTMLTLAQDAAGLISELGRGKVNVFGLSMGGMVAQELAINWPDRVRSLVLGATHCGGKTVIPPAPEVMQTMLSRAREGRPEPVDDKWLAAVFTPAFLIENPAAVKAYVKRTADRPTKAEIISLQAKTITAFDACARDRTIISPSWIVHGQLDAIVPVGNAFVLQSHIRFSRIVILPGLGHDFAAQSPEYTGWLLVNILKFDEAVTMPTPGIMQPWS